MIRASTFIHLRADAEASARDELTSALRSCADHLDLVALQVAPTEAPAHRAGDIMSLAAYADLESYDTARAHPYVQTVLEPLLHKHAGHVETVRYEQGPVILQEPDLRDGIQRTLLLRVDPACAPGAVAAFEHELADMTRYIDTIRNSSLSRVDIVDNPAGPAWTHVWEQEFQTLDGLTGLYMEHPYHWAFVDTWFDPQAPNHIVDVTLIHAMCRLDRSILALAGP
jgi:hypothetical protein